MKIASDSVDIEFNGETYYLSKLARHILYCINDGRDVSAKYTETEVNDAVTHLLDDGLIIIGVDGMESLTAAGDAVTLMLRDRPRES